VFNATIFQQPNNTTTSKTRHRFHNKKNNNNYTLSEPQALVSFKKYMPPPLPYFFPSPFRVNIFHLFVILSLTQLYRYTPEIFLFLTATFKYTYRAPLRRIGQEYSTFQSLKRIEPLPVRSKFI
jgi:hypothetical protein